MDAGGPRTARCSCPAAGICRHRITVLLALRATAAPVTGGTGGQAGPEPALASKAAPAPDPLAEILALESGAIAKWAGKPSLRAAAELLADAAAPEVRRDGAALAIRLSPDEPEVRWLAGQGLDGMVSKATRARFKTRHTAAVLATRRAHGLEEAAAVPNAAAAAHPEMPDAMYLEEVRRTLQDAVFTVLNQAPLVLEERLFTLSISSRGAALPRLGRQLRQLAAGMRQKREREFAFSPADGLSRLAATHALAAALARPQPPERLALLKGAVRQGLRAGRRPHAIRA
jgi:hypothetical protein